MSIEENPEAKEVHVPTQDDGSPKNATPRTGPFAIPMVSWRDQFMALVRWKTLPVLSRKPVSLAALLFSSVVSVIFSWLTGPDKDNVPPIGTCNAPDIEFFKVKFELVNETYSYFDGTQEITETFQSLNGGWEGNNAYEIPSTINDNWQGGLPVMLLSVGPLLTAIIVYFVVHEEIQLNLFGIIRGLGIHDSAYWMSWFIPFATIAMANSLLGAITAQIVPVHVYQSVYFGGIFATLWFLQLALIASSLFVSAVTGKAKCMVALWGVMFFLAVLIPWAITSFSSAEDAPIYILTGRPSSEVQGIFWYYQQTNQHSYNYPEGQYDDLGNVVDIRFNDTWREDLFSECTVPLMIDEEFGVLKTKQERQTLSKDRYFVGCFAQTGIPALLWNLEGPGKLVMAALYFLPYFHLYSIFGNFLGFTADQQYKFTMREAALSTASLVSRKPEFEDSHSGFAFSDGSLLALKDFDYTRTEIPCDVYFEDGFCNTVKSNCAESEGFCNIDQCSRGRTIDAPSVNVLFIHLSMLTVLYLMMAGYWGIAFISGNQPFYFPFLWSYWVGSSKPSDNAEGADTLEIKSVAKSYGTVTAVKDVSLSFVKGEITALLGHNGAGKTTLSNMIICETLPSQGSIYVFGRSVNDDSLNVRRMVGVCKQDDYLWPSLTAREHLFLFAELNGVDRDEEGKMVQKWLESVDLDLVQNQFSRQYSGGMKRRLSLALSTIGMRPLIVLDEPTTGMDPSSRRFVWRHIDLIKKERVILLTTHSMEEADLLADQVAIMKDGIVAAKGTSLELKTEYGSALQFNILAAGASVQTVVESIQNIFSESMEYVKIQSNASGNIALMVNAIKQAGTSDDGVEAERVTGFISWLEDTGDRQGILEYGFSNSALEEVFLKVTNSEGPIEESSEIKSTVPYGATTAFNNDSADEEKAIEGSTNPAVALDIGEKTGEINLFQQVRALLLHHFGRGCMGRRSIGTWASIGVLTAIVAVAGTGMAGVSVSLYGSVIPSLAVSLMALMVVLPIFGDRSDGQFYLMRSQGLMGGSYTVSYVLYATIMGVVSSVFIVSVYFATNVFRNPEICRPDTGEYCYSEFGDRPQVYDPFEISIQMASDEPGFSFIPSFRAHRSPSGYGPVLVAALVFGLSFPGIALASSFIPGNKIAMVLVTALLLASSVSPVLHLLFGIADVYSPGFEIKTKECLRMIAPNVECGESTTSLDNITVDTVNCIGAQVNSVAALSFCQPLSVGLLPQYGLFQTLSAALSWRITFLVEPAELVPVLITRLEALGLSCDGATCDFPFAQTYFWKILGYEILGVVLLLLLGIFVAMTISFPPDGVLRFKTNCTLLAAWADASTPDTDEVASSNEISEVLEERNIVRAETEKFIEEKGARDIKVNPGKIQRGGVSPVIMQRLRKVYPAVGKVPPKIALQSLDLHVPKGEVLGLLGKNGAGKTTALKILAGAHDATSGIGLVAGHDVGLERLEVFAKMGNCAQFDVIWPRLTVKEHLVFFTRLKGCPWKDSKETAHSIAVAVGLGLDDVYNRNAGSLSGGMRRRLSIAISLVSSPKVLILDEPTTGLDPATRKTIWDLITSLSTPERAMVLTTHQMVEADTLCNRIAIMAKGQLVVVGTQQYLKDKFGSGYILQLNLVHSTPENEAAALSFCREHLHPGASKSSKQAKTLHVRLPPGLDLKGAFSALYNPNVRPKCINQFLLNQSSLEDVFLALGDGYNLEENKMLEI